MGRLTPMQTSSEPMDTSKQFCPNETCCARGKMGEGNITIHDRKRQRYRCKVCKQTFSQRRGTMFEGLRKPMELSVIVVTLLSYGCPVQAIVHAFDLDERTVASWRDRAGAHCEQVHQALVEAGKLDLVHVQADEIRVKGRNMIAWMGQVRRSAQTLRPLLVLTDGWAAYPNSIRRAFREKVKKMAGVGRASLEVWSQLFIGTVIKRTENKRVVEITRKMAHGLFDQAEQLLQLSGGGSVLNTAFIERLNGTFRERLASLTRKSRHAASRMQTLRTGMYLIGCTYNFCFIHQELSKAKHWGTACTPAMASGLTDHVWSICEVLRYKVVPSPWVEPKRRGRPKKQAEQTVVPTKRQSFRPRFLPLVRLRKGVLCSITG